MKLAYHIDCGDLKSLWSKKASYKSAWGGYQHCLNNARYIDRSLLKYSYLTCLAMEKFVEGDETNDEPNDELNEAT